MYIKRKSFIQWLEHEIYLLGLMSGATIQFLIGIIPQMSDCCITAISYKDVWKLPYLNICMGLGRQLQVNIECHYTLRRVWSINHRVQEHKFTETQQLLSLGFKYNCNHPHCQQKDSFYLPRLLMSLWVHFLHF